MSVDFDTSATDMGITKPALIVRDGRRAGEVVMINKQLLMGRGVDCDLTFNDPRISRSHALVTRERTGIFIRDFPSQNGTWVNGIRLNRGRLHHRDIVRIGSVSLRVHIPRDAIEPSAETPVLVPERFAKPVEDSIYPRLGTLSADAFLTAYGFESTTDDGMGDPREMRRRALHLVVLFEVSRTLQQAWRDGAVLDQVADTVSDLGQKKPERNTMSQDARALVTSLVETHKGVEGSSMEHFLRGRTLMLRDNYANLVQARDQLEKAVVLDANNALALAALAELYGLLAHSGYDSLDLQRQSIYLLQMADASENYPAAVLRGHAAFDVYSGNFASGRTNAQAALQKNPEDPALHYLLGIAAMGKGNQITPEVQSHFDKALELDPSFHQVWYALAKAEEESGHLDKALEYYEKKIASDPGSSASHTRLASIHRSIGSYPTAMSHYDKAIGINRLEKDAFLDRAVLQGPVRSKASRTTCSALAASATGKPGFVPSASFAFCTIQSLTAGVAARNSWSRESSTARPANRTLRRTRSHRPSPGFGGKVAT